MTFPSSRATFYQTHWSRDGFISPFVYKEYKERHDSEQIRRRVLAMDAYLNHHPLVRARVGGVPVAALIRAGSPAPFGIAMRQFEGIQLSRFKPLRHLSKMQRLDLALDVATAVAILHGHGIVHGDITDTNILCSEEGDGLPKAELIDMDFAGVQDGDRWAQDLHPLMRAKTGDVYFAPELMEGRAPTISSDRWSLAVALHHLLLTPVNPLIVLGDHGINPHTYSPYANPTGEPYQWPPSATHLERAVVSRHRAQLKALGPKLEQGFIATFDQTKGRTPEDRVSATAWIRVLVAARTRS